MPISKFQLLGNWDKDARKYGYSKKDVGILTNAKAVEKIHRKWNNTKDEFDLYFVKSAIAYKQKIQDVGEVKSDWIKEKLGIDIPPNEESITLVFTNNVGEDRIPMTAWTIAHRLGHAIRKDKIFQSYFLKQVEKDFKELAYHLFPNDDPYKPAITPYEIAMNVGTMNSIRTNNLRNFYEFVFELLAQYITTGKIVFKPLTKNILLQKRFAWGRPNDKTKYSSISNADLIELNYTLKNMERTYEMNLDSIFGGLYGKIFIM